MLIRISDRLRFCYREVVAAGAFDINDRRSPGAPKRLEIAPPAFQDFKRNILF